MYNLNSDPKCFIQCFGSVSGSACFCPVRIHMKIFAPIRIRKKMRIRKTGFIFQKPEVPHSIRLRSPHETDTQVLDENAKRRLLISGWSQEEKRKTKLKETHPLCYTQAETVLIQLSPIYTKLYDIIFMYNVPLPY